ncbi:uncharacterized protein FSUBG_11269 [Fusarium subglutinans]|uniref:C2H2-type domain-containing protein n=1 Tax=Gibberella subglutinans TaxID=42677 RepID=A0A8H5LCA2_GIBSU|nr:uncharacterized protein FSUBG_11269 [Fusarium subglutinans]KAF5589018.1 hypothetical protein FSUBG_11269 [Fusarium subglutinans]
MSTITPSPSGLQVHQEEYGVGLTLHNSTYYSIAPKQKKLPVKVQTIIQQLIILSVLVDFYRSQRPSKNKNQQLSTKVQDEALSLPSTGGISAATRHYSAGANSVSNVVLLFPGKRRHCHWWILYCPAQESYASEAPSIGDKRAGSPGSGNQSGQKKKGSGRENNDRNSGKGGKGNGQSPGKKKRGFGPHQPFTKKLACLFFKLDPRKYQCCAGYKITEWDRLLQHLKRQHLIEGEHCPKCRDEFYGEDAETEKNEHIRQDTCVEETALETGLLLESEYEALNGLHGTHEEKWYKAWKKLFGEQAAPHSPFFETVDCMLEVQYSVMERELPTILQSFHHDALARPEGNTASTTIGSILRLLRNPIPTSNPLTQEGPQAVLAPSVPAQITFVPDMPPLQDPETWSNAMEPLRPSTDDVPDQPYIPVMEAEPFGYMLHEMLWRQPLDELPVSFDEDEAFRQWTNYSDGGDYFGELDNSEHT